MTRKINYEDDLFALSLVVRGLRDIARLEVDADLFADRLADDASFVDAASVRILSDLRASPFLVHRLEYLRSLQKLLRSLVRLLEELAGGRSPVAAALAARAADLCSRAGARTRDADAIETLLQDTAAAAIDDPHVVSEEELRILTAPSEEG
jgi:alkanesulfonate monooxygenase SsuD/methylene tetrahydromethanopterin reductase-like flavin-dependent oxidoreductase (luciferase family)